MVAILPIEKVDEIDDDNDHGIACIVDGNTTGTGTEITTTSMNTAASDGNSSCNNNGKHTNDADDDDNGAIVDNNNDDDNEDEDEASIASSSSSLLSSEASLLSYSSSSSSSNDDDEDEDNTTDNDRNANDEKKEASSKIAKASSSSLPLTLMERQARNIERNTKFLNTLKEKYDHKMRGGKYASMSTTATAKLKKRKKKEEEEGHRPQHHTPATAVLGEEHAADTSSMHGGTAATTGMMIPGTNRLFQNTALSVALFKLWIPTKATPTSTTSTTATTTSNNTFCYYDSYRKGIQLLEAIYPNRQHQIEQLVALVSGTISVSSVSLSLGNTTTTTTTTTTNNNNNDKHQVYVPSPIFCIGSKSTGKTTIVCDCIQLLLTLSQQQQLLQHQNQNQKTERQHTNNGDVSMPKTTKNTDTTTSCNSRNTTIITTDNNSRNAIMEDSKKKHFTGIDNNSSNDNNNKKKNIEKVDKSDTIIGDRMSAKRNAATATVTATTTTTEEKMKEKGEKDDHNLSRNEENEVQQQYVHVQPAYVDCSVVEPSTIERLVYTIYKQLRLSSSSSSSGAASTKKRKRRTATRHHRKQIRNNSNNNTNSRSSSSSNNMQKEKENQQQTKILPTRKAKRVATRRSMAYNTVTKFDNEIKKKRKNEEGEGERSEDDVETNKSAVMALGRSLHWYYGSGVTRGTTTNVGILVLDNAEELLSLSSSGKKKMKNSGGRVGATNYLSELLLLPKVMKLNITIIVISNYVTLDMTRLNNTVSPTKSLANISNAIHPIVVQFPAYKGRTVFQEILSTEQNERLVIGDSLAPAGRKSASTLASQSANMRPSLKNKLKSTFWNTVIQFASDSTRDVRDFLRLGRALWPEFISPLHPSNIRSTMTEVVTTFSSSSLSSLPSSTMDIRDNDTSMETMPDRLTKKNLQNESNYVQVEEDLLQMLGRRFHSKISNLVASSDDSNLTLLMLNETGMIVPSDMSSSCGKQDQRRTVTTVPATNLSVSSSAPSSAHQPYLRSVLLLAAFICQNNKSDQDRKLFSAHGTGRRRKSRANADIYGGNNEDLAFGTTKTNHSSSSSARDSAPAVVEQLKSLRMRPIPLERVLSVFVKLVEMHPIAGTENKDGNNYDYDYEVDLKEVVNDLGSTRLYKDLSHLIDIGYLHPAKGNHIHLSPARYLCSLTREEAIGMSTSIGIPIERFLI